ncbi:MAG: FAD-binding oxidoreductase [Cellvibrionales bacterium]|nr:FAD-binding oxidoreductase [Cellvibrionales bacterium]
MPAFAEHVDSWYAASAGAAPSYTSLKGGTDADVCIIGAGYTGLSSAIHLAERGYKVVVLEANRVGWGASGRNGGHVGTGQRADQSSLEKWVGRETAGNLWQLGLDAVDLVCELVETHHIDCELGVGNLHMAAKASHAVDLEHEVNQLTRDYGYTKASYLNREELAELTSASGMHGGMLDMGARHLHPLKYTHGLARVASSLGVTIYEQSPAVKWRDNSQLQINTPQGSVTAKAGNIMPINNFVIATEPLSSAQQQAVTKNNYSLSDSLFVINYWKLSGDGRLLFGGGENYTSRFPKDIKGFVRPYMLNIYPELTDVKIDYGWGGTLGITMNRMPDFGRIGSRIFYAQGFSGHGVPTATMAGKLLAAAIDGDGEKFNLMASVPTHRFPGGTLLRWPGLVAGMLYYSLLDKLGS